MPEETQETVSTESTTKGGPIPRKKAAKKAAPKKAVVEPKGSGADRPGKPVTVKVKAAPADNPRLAALKAEEDKKK